MFARSAENDSQGREQMTRIEKILLIAMGILTLAYVSLAIYDGILG